MGPGWTHSYNIRLTVPFSGSTDIILVGPQGRSDLYTYDDSNSYTPPDGVYTTLMKNDDGTYTATHKDQSKWFFDVYGKLIRIEDRYGNISLLGYNGDDLLESIGDPAGRGSLTLAYNADGLLTSVTDWMVPARTVSYEYDSEGRLWHVTDRELKVTTFEYDGTTHSLESITDANGNVAVTNTYDADGRVATQKDAQGLSTGEQTTFQYNDNGDGTKTTLVTYPATSSEPSWHPIEEDTYDSEGRITTHVSKPTSNPGEWITETHTWNTQSNRTSATDGRGNTTNYCYDVDYAGAPISGNQGNLTRLIEPAAEPGAPRPVTLYSYDSKNNLVQTIPPKGVSSGTSVTCSTDLSGAINPVYVTDMAYDAGTQTKLLSVTKRYIDPDLGGQTTVTKYEYNDPNNAGKVTRMIPPKGNTGPTPDPAYATTYNYFQAGAKFGLMEQETDPNGNITTHDYDVVGRETSMVDPNGNAPGGVPADHTWTYQYDKEDRVLFVRAPAPQSGGSPLVTESRYDDVGNNIISIDANGQVTSYSYDNRDSLKEVRESPNPWTDPNSPPAGVILTEYKYDPLGNMSQMTRAKGDTNNERVTRYAYDGLNRVRTETQYPSWPSTSGALVTAYSYDKSSNRHTLTDPLGRTDHVRARRAQPVEND